MLLAEIVALQILVHAVVALIVRSLGICGLVAE